MTPTTTPATTEEEARRVTVGIQGWAAPAFFAVLIVGSAVAVDATVPNAYGTPKSYLIPVVVTGAVVAWAARGLWRRSVIRVSALELLLALAAAFGLLAHPGLLTRSDALSIRVGLALLGVTFLARQLRRPVTDAPAAPADEGPGWALVHAVWICGVILALPVLRHALFASGPGPVIGSLGSVNGLGAMLALGVVAAAAAALRARRLGDRSLLRWLYAAAAVCGVALLVNGSRGAMLGVVGGGGVLVLLSPRRNGTFALAGPRKVWVAAVAGGLFLSLLAGLALLDPGSSGGRLLVWRITLPMIADHPLIGVGPGQFGGEYPAYQAAFWAEGTNLQWAHKASDLVHPHSDLLLKAAEDGLPGGLLWLAVWLGAGVALLRNALRRPGSGAGSGLVLLALLVTVLVHGAVDTLGLVVPVAVTGHLILGLTPMPEFTVKPGRRAWALGLVATTLGGSWGMTRLAQEYNGQRLWLQGRSAEDAEAVETLRRASLHLPGHARLQSELGTAVAAVGSPADGIRILEASLDLGAPPTTRLTLGEAYLSAGDPVQAETQARAYLAIFPDQLRPRLLLARSFLARGEREAARRELARCIRRETVARSAAVDAVAAEARAVWELHFDEPPPLSEESEAAVDFDSRDGLSP